MVKTWKEDLQDFAGENHVPILREEAQNFLLKLVKEENKKTILELGTAIAYTSIALAKLNPEIQVDTVERDEEMYLQALENVRQAQLDRQIRCYGMDIDDFEPSRSYDVIFVDAAKAQYEKYFQRFAPYLKQDGFFFFDNMIFHGMIYKVDQLRNRSTRHLVRRICQFREKVRLESNYNAVFYDKIGDGILIMRRRDMHES